MSSNNNRPLFNSSKSNNNDTDERSVSSSSSSSVDSADPRARSNNTNQAEQNDDTRHSDLNRDSVYAALLQKYINLDRTSSDDLNLPSTWKEVHSPEFMNRDVDSMAELIFQITEISNDPDEILAVTSHINPIAFITISSGIKHKPTILHSLTEFESNDGTIFDLALTGSSSRPAAVELSSNQLFKKEKAKVPDLEYFISRYGENPIPPNQKDTIEICYSIALTPSMTKLFMDLEEPSARNMLVAALTYCRKQDVVVHPTYADQSKDDEEEVGDRTLQYNCSKAHLRLFQHLYYYMNMKSARMPGYHLADHEAAATYLDSMNAKLAPSQKPSSNSNHKPPPLKRSSSAPPSSSQKRTQISQDSQSQQDQPLRNSSTLSSDSSSSRRQQQPRPNHNSRFSFTGIDSPKERSSIGSQTNQRRDHSHSSTTHSADAMSLLLPAIQNLTNHQSRFTGAMERFVNDI